MTPASPTYTLRYSLSALMLLALGACDPISAEAVDLRDVVEVRVDGAPTCLGVWVSPNAALTALHCVLPRGAGQLTPLSRIRLRTQGGSELSVVGARTRLSSYDSLGTLSGRDLVILTSDAPRARRGMGAGDVGVASEGAEAIGVRAAMGGTIETSIRSLGSEVLYTDALTCAGDSGGPLYDSSGDLVGIASWRSPGPCGEGMSIFTRVDVHRDWIWPSNDSADADPSD